MSILHLCFCSDINLIKHLPVVLNSVYKTNKQYNIIVHYIHNIPNKEPIEELENTIKYHFSNMTLKTYLKEWTHEYNGLGYIPNATMLRLYIPDLVSADKVLYLDIDIIVNMDLMEIYKLDTGEKGICMKDSYVKGDALKRCMRISNKSGILNNYNWDCSGNAGVILLDLNKLRVNNFTKFCLDKNNIEAQNDQILINLYCEGKHNKLAPHYNVFYTQDLDLIKKHNNYILHYFTKKNKPYQGNGGLYQYLWDQNKLITNNIRSDAKKINFGVLVYNNNMHKFASSNIGDYIQSLATINIYRKIVEKYNNKTHDIDEFLSLIIKNQIENFNFIFIKRDNLRDLSQYKDYKNIITIMNGWFMHPYNNEKDISFPPPDNIIPIYVSFHIANPKLLNPQNITYFKKYQPIGCRDNKTVEKLKKEGVDAYFSGCLTTTIDFYKWINKSKNVYCIDTVVSLKNVIKINHIDINVYKNIAFSKGLKIALSLLKKYSEGGKVYTSRLHAFLPCLAMNVPVEFIAPDGDKTKRTWGPKDRFDGLRELKDKVLLNELQTKLINDITQKIENKIINM